MMPSCVGAMAHTRQLGGCVCDLGAPAPHSHACPTTRSVLEGSWSQCAVSRPALPGWLVGNTSSRVPPQTCCDRLSGWDRASVFPPACPGLRWHQGLTATLSVKEGGERSVSDKHVLKQLKLELHLASEDLKGKGLPERGVSQVANQGTRKKEG